MSALVDHLADLTGFRDRDVLDVTLVSAIRDLLDPDSVAVHRQVDDAGTARWLTRARLRRNEVSAVADTLCVDPTSLPPLSDEPERHRCLVEQCVVEVPGRPHRTYLPLSTEHGAVGVLEIDTAAPLAPADQRLVQGVTRLYRNVLALLDYSERDTLTGLLNRRTFDEAFMKTAAGRPDARRLEPIDSEGATASGYWIGVIDVDHFKRVNDQFGHLIGDEVLLLLARLLRATFRGDDRLYRFGGEEFVVLLHCPGEAQAARAFERLRANVEAYAFPQVGTITVSIGFAEVRPGDPPAVAFDRADQAVYDAKGHGRNQVCSHAAMRRAGFVEDDAHVGGVELF
jgi:diguanylate cyclase (GGDEF)-like protein